MIDEALRDSELADISYPSQAEAFRQIQKGLSTITEFNTELITVSYEADTPDEAIVVLNAVLRAYDEIYGGRGGSDFRSKRQLLLAESRSEYRQQRDLKRRELRDIISQSEYGATNLNEVLIAKLLRIDQLKQLIEQFDLAILDAPAIEEPLQPDDLTDDVLEPTMTDLEFLDEDLETFYDQRESLLIRIQQLAKLYGSRHQTLRQARRELELLEAKIELRENAAREKWFAMGGDLPITTTPESIDSLTQLDLRLQQFKLSRADHDRFGVSR